MMRRARLGMAVLAASACLWGCGKEAPKPAAGERRYEVGSLEEMGRSKLAAYAGRQVVAVLGEGDYAAAVKTLEADRARLMLDLSFELAGCEELDAEEPKAVAEWVRQWLHERYWEGKEGPIRRVELRMNPAREAGAEAPGE